jgi:hypothetical protein
MQHKELERNIGRWFFFSSVTSRYSYSPETQMEADLNYFKNAKNKNDYVKLINAAIESELTNDFWDITTPNKLLVSSSKVNAIRNAYFACLIKRGANVLFSDRKIGDLFTPELKKRKKDLERHHIFPRNYLLKEFKLDSKQINQVANFTYLEYEENIDISDDPPKKYFLEKKEEYYTGKEEELNKMMAEHCLPDNFYDMEYGAFLKERRKLIAKLVRTVFESL